MSAESPEPQDGLRASHADREEVVERLREAAAEGRIDLTELDTRLEQALTAKTYGELAPLTADLAPVIPAHAREPLVLKGGLNGVSRTGRWQVPVRITVYGGMGGASLDFTRTECRLPEIELEAHGQLAGVTIVIPDSWAARTDGLDPGIGGLKDRTTADRLPGTPLVHLTGSGGAAGVVIRHRNAWERHRARRQDP